jgi:hypothetical protein
MFERCSVTRLAREYSQQYQWLGIVPLNPVESAFFFDDYCPHLEGYSSVEDWLRSGANLSYWRTNGLRDDLISFRNSVPLDDNNWSMGLLEEPFGLTRPELADLIDFCVFIDVPLEIALLRKITTIRLKARARYNTVFQGLRAP